MNEVTVYCDGSAIGNPGPGGWGVVSIDGSGNDATVRECGGADVHTTNNRMELTAAIEALKCTRANARVTIKTDSQYVINGITKWVFGWEKNGWQTSQKTEVLNKDLWQALTRETQSHSVTWEHVRGHVGVVLNERVDQIANGFARKENVTLFSGTKDAFDTFLSGMPKARTVGSSSKGKAYSYVSVVDGVVAVSKTWAECEKRVKGKKAQFKKVHSKEEESALVAEWS